MTCDTLSQMFPFPTLAETFRVAALLLLALFQVGCGKPDSPSGATTGVSEVSPSTANSVETPSSSSIRFDDLAAASGVHFIPRNGREAGLYTILESLGTGIGLVDFDADGNLDIVAAGGGTFDENGNPTGLPTGVFRQNNLLKFDDVSATCGIDTGSVYTHGIAVADWNNDGFGDIVITGFHAVRVFQNEGDGTFQDVTVVAGIAQTSWSTSVAFLDADNDGDLELYVVNYVDWQPDPDRECIVKGQRDVCPPGLFSAASDWLYHNHGDGTFGDVSANVGLVEGGKGLAVMSGDVDLDGDSDIYVANDTNANFLYLNNANGGFEEQALISGCALGATMIPEGSMGVAFADFNSDGLPDIWVSNYERQSFAMYQSRAPGIFQHVSAVTGISAVGQMYVGFGTVALDADLDGDQDIFAANGHVMYETESAPLRQLPLIYENQNGKRFRNVADESGEYGRGVHMGRGVAAGDLDQDGGVDLVVAHTNEPISILRNSSVKKESWVAARLIGTVSNRSAVGAIAKVNGRLGIRCSGGSYLSDSSSHLCWSVPAGEKHVQIEVFWPSGRRQTQNLLPKRFNSVVEHLAGSGIFD